MNAALQRSVSRAALALVAIAALVGFAACKKHAVTAKSERQAPAEILQPAGTPANDETPRPQKRNVRTVYATWYDVPRVSVAARRAGVGEYTAAHNKLPIGTRLRVTRVGTDKTVIVRITDRGIPRGKPPLDLCRGAAEELGMISDGKAKVQMEVLPDEPRLGALTDSQSAAPHP